MENHLKTKVHEFLMFYKHQCEELKKEETTKETNIIPQKEKTYKTQWDKVFETQQTFIQH